MDPIAVIAVIGIILAVGLPFFILGKIVKWKSQRHS